MFTSGSFCERVVGVLFLLGQECHKRNRVVIVEVMIIRIDYLTPLGGEEEYSPSLPWYEVEGLEGGSVGMVRYHATV